MSQCRGPSKNTCDSVWTGRLIGNVSSRVHQAIKTRSSMVEAARCQAARLLGRLADPRRVSRTGPEAFRDDHLHNPDTRMGCQLREVRPNTKPGLPVSGNAFQHSTVYSGAPAENASQGLVNSSALDEQSHHHSKRSTQVAGHGGVHGNAGVSWQVKTLTNPVVGRHSLVSEDWKLDRKDHSSSVGLARSGLVGITCSPARSSSRHSGNGSHIVHRCVQLWLGSPTRLTLDSGTVVSVSKIIAYKHSGDAGCNQLTQWGASCLIWGPEWFAWCGTMQSLLPTSRTRGALYPTLSCSWRGEPQIEMFATFANRRLIKFVPPYPDPRAVWTDAMSTTWDNGRGLLYAFLPFKLVPQVLQKIYQCYGVQMILVAPKQETASWFPEPLELSQEDPIPLYSEGQPLLTQGVILPDREMKQVTAGRQIYTHGDFAGHPSGKGAFAGSCRYDVKIPTSVIATSVWITLGKIRPFL